MRWNDRLLSLDAFRRILRRENPESWLSDSEFQWALQCRTREQRDRWLGGRWLAKQVLIEMIPDAGFLPRDLHIESRNERSRPTRPRVFLRGCLRPWSLSISHSDEALYVGVTICSRLRVGADVVEVESLPPGLSEFWFTRVEQKWSRLSPDRFSDCLLWSLKEARYKAENQGEPFAPRRVDVVAGTPLEHSPKLQLDAGVRTVLSNGGVTMVLHRTSHSIATLILVDSAGADGSTLRTRDRSRSPDNAVFMHKRYSQ